MQKYERRIFFLVCAIMVVSFFALYSSCHQKGEFVRQEIFFKQLFWFLIGMVVMGIFSRIDYRILKDFAWPLYLLSIATLVLVAVFGRSRLGAQRWLGVGGINFQPSEFGKLALLLLLARYFSQKTFEEIELVKTRFSLVKGFLIPLVLTGVIAVLVLAQPDLGTAMIYFFVFLSLVYFCGVRWQYITAFLGIGIALSPLFWLCLRGYQRDRLLVFLNPDRDPLGAGYTIIQSKIAIGSGGIFGRGWLAGTQNQLNFLAERHTDFIFSTIGEEWGFVGGLIIILSFYFLVRSMLRLAHIVSDPFAQIICVGIASLIGMQFFINIAMTIGIMPVVGLPLPFVSYGGSSLVSFLLLIGIVLNICKG